MMRMMVKKYTKIRSETDLLNLVEIAKEPIYIEVQYINYRRKLAKPVGSQKSGPKKKNTSENCSTLDNG